MQHLFEHNLIEEFIKGFPEFKDKAQEERDSWHSVEEEPPSLILENVLIEFLVTEALVTMDNPELLKRLFAFMERMALSPNKCVQNILGVWILERIGDDKEVLARARVLMGRYTLRMSHEIEKGWGRE